jgi:hypothetical protein
MCAPPRRDHAAHGRAAGRWLRRPARLLRSRYRIPHAGRPCGPRASRCTWTCLGRKTVHRGRLCFIRPASRPCAALQWGVRRGWCATALPCATPCPAPRPCPVRHRPACKAARGWAAARIKHRRLRWVTPRPTTALDSLMAHAGRGVAQRREFGSAAQRRAERRSHRAAARPRAALPPPNAAAIASKLSHAQLCHPECRGHRIEALPRAALPPAGSKEGKKKPGSAGPWIARRGRAYTFITDTARVFRYASSDSGPPSEP